MVNKAPSGNTPNKAENSKDAAYEKLVQKKLKQRGDFTDFRERLPVKEMPGFQTCWVTQDKVDYYKEQMLYDFVDLSNGKALEIIENADTADEVIKNGAIVTGKNADGSTQYSYLMARPIPIRDALREEQQAKNDELMNQIVKGQKDASTNLRGEDEENAYVRQADFSVTKGERVL